MLVVINLIPRGVTGWGRPASLLLPSNNSRLMSRYSSSDQIPFDRHFLWRVFPRTRTVDDWMMASNCASDSYPVRKGSSTAVDVAAGRRNGLSVSGRPKFQSLLPLECGGRGVCPVWPVVCGTRVRRKSFISRSKSAWLLAARICFSCPDKISSSGPCSWHIRRLCWPRNLFVRSRQLASSTALCLQGKWKCLPSAQSQNSRVEQCEKNGGRGVREEYSGWGDIYAFRTCCWRAGDSAAESEEFAVGLIFQIGGTSCSWPRGTSFPVLVLLVCACWYWCFLAYAAGEGPGGPPPLWM